MAKILNHIEDILGLAGVAFVFYGLWQIYSPASYIFVGIMFLFVAFGRAMRRESGEE